MSLQHEINKCIPSFAEAVKAIMSKNVMDRNGSIRGTQRVWGYVCKINDDTDDENYGTVDVQEYEYDAPEGLHENVYLSSLQNNDNGYVVIPSLYSDVIIAQDPVTLVEYVMLASHVDLIQMRSHKNAMIGVVETEEFVEDQGDDGTDVPDLAETGNAATSEYTKDNIIHTVKTSSGNVTITQDINGVRVEAQDSTINIKADGSISIEGKKINIKGDNTTIDSSNITLKGTAIKHNDGGQKMVLGDKLVAHLQQLCTALSTLTVTCGSAGSPSSPPLNLAQFQSISTQLQSDLSQKSKLD